MEIRVKTYSGYKADEYPVQFQLQDQWFDIIDIEDRWYGPAYSYFKVFADDGKRYLLKHTETLSKWEIHPM